MDREERERESEQSDETNFEKARDDEEKRRDEVAEELKREPLSEDGANEA
jgi:hypothetical protein